MANVSPLKLMCSQPSGAMWMSSQRPDQARLRARAGATLSAHPVRAYAITHYSSPIETDAFNRANTTSVVPIMTSLTDSREACQEVKCAGMGLEGR